MWEKTTNNIGYSLYVDTGGTGFGRFDGADCTAVAPPLMPGVFSHVVGTFDGSILALYVNGAGVAVATNTVNLPIRTVAFAIGAKGEGTGSFFVGSIDEVAVYGRALTAAEVAAHYTAGTR